MSSAGQRRRFRPTALTGLQARLGRRLLLLVGRGLFRLRFEFVGLEHLPRGEPLIVAAAPHRNWIDPFLIVVALPPTPRVSFLGSAEAMFNTWWKRAIVALVGGVVPVSTQSGLNREGPETSLAILATGNRLGIFPEGWEHAAESAPAVQPIKRGVAFLSQRSGCRVLPIGLAGTEELWRGKTLRLQVGPPLAALAPDAGRVEAQAYAARIGDAIRAAVPARPPEPAAGKKPWPWLTRLLG